MIKSYQKYVKYLLLRNFGLSFWLKLRYVLI